MVTSKSLSVIIILLTTSNLHLLTPKGQGQGVRAQSVSGLGPDQLTMGHNTGGAARVNVTEADTDNQVTDSPSKTGPNGMAHDIPLHAHDVPPKVLHVEELHYDFTGMQDVVVLLDRSASVGFYDMEEDGKDFMETMLRTAYIIHPQYTRLAVITFAGTATTVFDSITGEAITGCGLFAKAGLWEDIRYDTDDQNGANVRAAVKKARSILDAGRLNRPEVTSQSLWLVTDAEYGTEEFLLWTSYVKDDSVKVYGAGMGANLNETKMRSIVSTPPEYYYHRTTDWLDILKKGLMEKRNVTDGLYEKVDMSLCGFCGTGATCYCDTLSDRLPLCACNQHFYPQGNECIECPSGSHKSVWGNKTCSDCSDETSLLGGVKPDRCNSEMKLVVIIAIAVGGAVLLIIVVISVLWLRRRKRRKRHGSDSSDGESPNIIYTQTYSTPESARALVGATKTQKTLIGHANTGAFPCLSPQTSNMSTDSGVSMSTNPHYIDPIHSNNHSNNINMLPSGGSSNKNHQSNRKNINLAPPGQYTSHDYIEVVEASASDSDHEDPKTIANLSLKYRDKKSKKKQRGAAGPGGRRARVDQPPRRDQAVGGAGKTRMPSPSRDTQTYENATETNRLTRFKNRLSRTFGISNDYTNSEEIDKLKKRGGRASAKISAYQVRNIVHMFEKSDSKTALKKASTLPANLPSKNPAELAANATPAKASNGVVLRVHNNLAPSKSHPANVAGVRALPGMGGAVGGGVRTLPGKLLNVEQQRRGSTYSMDSDGYMKPVLDPSSHASYIDLIPDPNITNNSNNNASESRLSDDDPIYELAAANGPC